MYMGIVWPSTWAAQGNRLGGWSDDQPPSVLKVSYSKARLQAERFELSSSAWKADSLALNIYPREEGFEERDSPLRPQLRGISVL